MCLDAEKWGMEELRKAVHERNAELNVAIQFSAPTATTKRALEFACELIEPPKDAAGDEGGTRAKPVLRVVRDGKPGKQTSQIAEGYPRSALPPTPGTQLDPDPQRSIWPLR